MTEPWFYIAVKRVCVPAPSLGYVWHFVTPWAIAHRLLCPCNFPAKNTGVGGNFLLQGIFLTQGSNQCLLCFQHWQADSLPLHHSSKRHAIWDSLFCHNCFNGFWLKRTQWNRGCWKAPCCLDGSRLLPLLGAGFPTARDRRFKQQLGEHPPYRAQHHKRFHFPLALFTTHTTLPLRSPWYCAFKVQILFHSFPKFH